MLPLFHVTIGFRWCDAGSLTVPISQGADTTSLIRGMSGSLLQQTLDGSHETQANCCHDRAIWVGGGTKVPP